MLAFYYNSNLKNNLEMCWSAYNKSYNIFCDISVFSFSELYIIYVTNNDNYILDIVEFEF